jgi:hypothetical protein
MSKLKEGGGAGYTVLVKNIYLKDPIVNLLDYKFKGNTFYFKFETKSKKFEFDAEWEGYDWGGKEDSIKGDNLEITWERETELSEILGMKYMLEATADVRADEMQDETIWSIDDLNDFIHGDLDESIYMEVFGGATIEEWKLFFAKQAKMNHKEIYEDLFDSDNPVVSYKELIGAGWSHVNLSYLGNVERFDAETEYDCSNLENFFLESQDLNDLVNYSYEDRYNDDEE